MSENLWNYSKDFKKNFDYDDQWSRGAIIQIQISFEKIIAEITRRLEKRQLLKKSEKEKIKVLGKISGNSWNQSRNFKIMTTNDPVERSWDLSLYELHRTPQEAITDDTEIAVSARSLQSELTCPICLDMLTNTMTTKECLHR